MKISAFTISRNLLSLGYPYIETALSLIDVVDEYVVLECGSQDNTEYWWEMLRHKYPEKVRIEYGGWPDTTKVYGSGEGRVSGIAQDRGLELCTGDYALCAHADEVWHPESAVLIPHYCSLDMGAISIPYLHLANNFQTLDEYNTQCFTQAEMLVKTNAGWSSDGDGWRFWKGKGPTMVNTSFPKPLCHVGYVFPVNLHRKRINHAKLYPAKQMYQDLAAESEQALASGEFGPLFDKTTSPYDLPAILKPLVGVKEYFIRPELFG